MVIIGVTTYCKKFKLFLLLRDPRSGYPLRCLPVLTTPSKKSPLPQSVGRFPTTDYTQTHGARRYCLINLGNTASIAVFARTSCSSSLLLFCLLRIIAVTDFIITSYYLFRRPLEIRANNVVKFPAVRLLISLNCIFVFFQVFDG